MIDSLIHDLIDTFIMCGFVFTDLRTLHSSSDYIIIIINYYYFMHGFVSTDLRTLALLF